MRIVRTGRLLPALLLLLAFQAFAAPGQTPDSSLLTLERLYDSPEFSGGRFGPARWIDGGAGYTTLERSKEDPAAREIARYDTKTGTRRILVTAALLTPPGAGSPLSISDYAWSPDGSRLLIFTNTGRVWRTNTRGDYWVLDLKSGALRKLGGDAAPSALMFAKFSPDGSRVAYVRANDIFVEQLSSGKINRLTADGSATTINGTFDWLYEEEFFLHDGFQWSPDGASIAFWQLNADSVGTFYLLNNTDSLYSKPIPIRYPKAGTTNPACRIGVVDANGGPVRWMQVPGDPRNNYIPHMGWAAGSSELVLEQIPRRQNTVRVMLADARSGEVRTVFTDQDSAWVEPVDSLLWLNDGRSFTWESERDGWRHVYTVSRTGGDVRCITPWPFDVIQTVKVDEQGGWLYFIASPDNPAQRYLYRSRLSGKGRPERLTPAGLPGTHTYDVSPDARWAFHRYSTFATPWVTSLVQLPDHRTVRVLADNARLAAKVKSLRWGAVDFLRLDIGGVQLDAWRMQPPDFDSTRKYPLLVYVYGEPAAQTVLDQWSSQTLWHLLLNQKGYVVMSVDNRGTPAPRGRAWRKCIYRQIGVLAAADQAAAVRTVIAGNPCIDAARVGVWGWSGGGSMSLNAIFRYPELYQTAVAVAAVPDQRLYDTIYQERYMDTPENNPEGYRNGSPITWAHQLKGNLLLVHGTGDDNVHFQGAERLVNELVRLNKQFAFMPYPNRSHGIYEGPGTTLHLFTLITNYLVEHLPAGARPKTSPPRLSTPSIH